MRRRMFVVALLLALPVMLSAKDKPDTTHPSPVDGPGVTTPDGLKYWDIVQGKGMEVVRGSKVKVHYTGWLLEDGKKFDSSHDRFEPFTFTVGAGDVIRGWDLGVVGMRVGGKRQLRIPPDLGYGWRGAPPDIPRNAYLIFDVEVLSVK